MDQAEASNPYEAPEASIAALGDEPKLSPSHQAISVLCLVMGGLGLLFGAALIFMVTGAIYYQGWGWVGDRPHGQRMVLAGALDLLTTTTFFAARRFLRRFQASPGLSLCALGIGLAYLFLWLCTTI